MKPQPKFKVTDSVMLTKPTLYDEYKGVIEGIDELYSTGKGGKNDSNYRLSDLPGMRFTFKRIDDVTIELYYSGELLADMRKIWPNYPEVETIKFHHYSYDIRTPKMFSSYPERMLILSK